MLDIFKRAFGEATRQRPAPFTLDLAGPAVSRRGKVFSVGVVWVWGVSMGESKTRRVRASSGLKEHLFLNSRLSPYGRAAIALWPDNAPKVLSERAGISIRNANQIMRGERRVTAKILLILNDEILR